MINYLPFFYPLIERESPFKDRPNCLLFNEPDSRGFLSIGKAGEISDIPKGIQRVQVIYTPGKSPVSFFSSKFPDTPKVGFWTANATKVINERVESIAQISDRINLKDLTYDEMKMTFADFSRGQLYDSLLEARKALKVMGDGIQIGEFFFSVIQSSGTSEYSPDDIMRIKILSRNEKGISFYLVSDKNIVDLNTRCYDLKRNLFSLGHEYYEPKLNDFEKMMASAFPGNSFAVSLETEELEDATV